MVAKALGWLVLLSFCSFAARAGAEPPRVDTAYLAEMPKAELVRAKIKGSDPVQTAARQNGAFHQLRDICMDLSQHRLMFGRATAAEHELFVSYTAGETRATSEGIALLERGGAPKTGFNAASPTFTRMSTSYQFDPDLKRELMRTFFSDAFAQRYAAVVAQDQQRRAAASPPSSTSTEQSSVISWGGFGRDATRAFESLLQNALLSALLGVLALALLSYPVLAFVRSRRVSLWTETGTVLGKGTSVHRYTTYTSGSYNPSTGHHTPSSSTTNTSLRLEFFLDTGAKHQAITLWDSGVALADGQRVTAVYASRKKNGYGYVCLIRNHTTQRSYTVKYGYRWARGFTARVSFVWTLLLTLAGVGALSLLGALGFVDAGTIVAIAGTLALIFWISGGIAMRVYHAFGDRRILRDARALSVAS